MPYQLSAFAPARPFSNTLRRTAQLLLAAVIAPLCATFGLADSDIYQLRTEYKRAISAIERGHSGEFRSALAALSDYPLHPYLVYFDARRKLGRVSASEAVALKTRLSDTHLGERLFEAWLITQARHGRWQTYRDHYEPMERTDGRCFYARSLYRTGDRAAALQLVPELWVVGVSQPKECDPLFAVWMAQDGLTDDLVWERLRLALAGNERVLARYLLGRFTSARASAARALYDGHVRPGNVRRPSRFPNTSYGAEAVGHALARYARTNPVDAAKQWRTYARRSMPEDTRVFILERLTAALALAGEAVAEHLDTPVDAPGSARFNRDMALASVLHQRWSEAARRIGAMDEEQRTAREWRYWLGRALSETGSPGGETVLAEVARHRSYYGFLAAQKLGIEPSLNARPAAPASRPDHSAIERMLELYAVGDLVNARREWNWMFEQFSPPDQSALIELAADIGWINQAIYGANRPELIDLVTLRFPTPYLHLYRRLAFQADIRLPLLLAVTRKESAFNPRAVSPSGAVGLMQLMPPTARHTASRARLEPPSRRDLFDPVANIELGAHYLAELMDRYDGHRVLVAGAYNAGPSRVDGWRRERRDMPADAWIEAIPISETRDYVQAVLAFDLVYTQLLGGPVSKLLRPHEERVP